MRVNRQVWLGSEVEKDSCGACVEKDHREPNILTYVTGEKVGGVYNGKRVLRDYLLWYLG